MKKKVIAYLHTHWDREWYREFEVFRLRLVRVFDEVLELLEKGKIPSFYFDGQTAAIEDYLKLNPEKEPLVKKLIKQKKLFIGPFYTLVDEFLTTEKVFRKNLELGLKYAKNLGCEDFLGYFADTFGHSKIVPLILKDFGINKAIVWRGCPAEIPSEFLFNGVKTVNLIRGYFNDIFSTNKTIKEKSEFIKSELDKIAEKSSNVLLMPIGADHLGIEADIAHQIKEVNKHLEDYEIELSSPFKYFELAKNNFKFQYDEELRDNAQTFVLPGSLSARIKLKQYNLEASYKLHLANKFQEFAQKKYKVKSYENVINHAYKLLLKNLAHDGICGCSTDEVHEENIMRYKKILQISNTVIEEIKHSIGEPSNVVNLGNVNVSGVVEFETTQKMPKDKCQLIRKRKGFSETLLCNIRKIPVTEDYTTIYTYLTEIENKTPSRLLSKANKLDCKILAPHDLNITKTSLENAKIGLFVKNGKFSIIDKKTDEIYENFLEFVDYKDLGDTYNFAPDIKDKGIEGKIKSTKISREGKLQCALEIKIQVGKTVLPLIVSLNKGSEILNFKIKWNNKTKNHKLQAKFNLKQPVTKTLSQDLGHFIEREFDPEYDMKKHLPKEKGIETKTNSAPMTNYVWAQGVGIVARGLWEYEVFKNSISVTLLRSIGIISNPKNPARTTPAGPPIPVEGAQQLGENKAEFSVTFTDNSDWEYKMNELFSQIIINKE